LASDSDDPPNVLTFTLAAGPAGAQIDAATGAFTWTTTEADGPSTNTIVVVVTDNGSPTLSATQSFTVVVREVNTAPVLAPIADRTIHQGATVTVTNSATDIDLPGNQLTYSLSNAPAGAIIGASDGLFTWTPAAEQTDSTNEITVTVTDDGSPNLSHSQSFTVTVLPPPLITSIGLSGTDVIISWSAIPNTVYRVQYKTDLEETTWTDLPDVVVADSTAASKIDPHGSEPQRFYRVIACP
jgi:hypothetical protein